MDDKIKKALLAAVAVAHDRQGDVSTDDGGYATTNIDSMIELETALCDAFSSSSDDVIYQELAPKIKAL